MALLWYLIGRADLALVAPTFMHVHSHSVLLLQHVQLSQGKELLVADTPSYRNVLIGGAAIRNPWHSTRQKTRPTF